MKLTYPEEVLALEELDEHTRELVLFDEVISGKHYEVREIVVDAYKGYLPQNTRYLYVDGTVESVVENDQMLPLQAEYLEAMLSICMEVSASFDKKIKVLINGGGALALPLALLYADVTDELHVCEADPVVAELARHYFMEGFQKEHLDYSKLHLHETDCVRYMEELPESIRFDVIANDVFSGNAAFAPLFSEAAIALQKEHLLPNGFVLTNVVGKPGDSAHALGLEDTKVRYTSSFSVVDALAMSEEDASVSTDTPDNFVVVATDVTIELG